MLDHSPEQLSQDAANAKALGVSYGQYKALQKDGRLEPPKIRAEAPDQSRPKTGEKLCRACGRPLQIGTFRRSYCSDVCRYNANREAIRAYQRKKYHEKKKQS